MYNPNSLNKIVYGGWFVFALYWLISAMDVKRDVRSGIARRGRSFSLVRIIIAVSLASMFPTIITKVLGRTVHSPRDVDLRYAGVALTLAGLSFAIWARYHLGRNWSGHPSLKEGHELVTSGPYDLVRHPIYTGMLTASLGSMLGTVQAFWLYFFVIMSIAFVYRIHVEEAIMMNTFPDTYPSYRKRTKALIPFVW